MALQTDVRRPAFEIILAHRKAEYFAAVLQASTGIDLSLFK